MNLKRGWGKKIMKKELTDADRMGQVMRVQDALQDGTCARQANALKFGT
jgi:hypothetical protein